MLVKKIAGWFDCLSIRNPLLIMIFCMFVSPWLMGATIRTAGGGGSGTVTSVATDCGTRTTSGSPITSTGTVEGAIPVNAQVGTTYTVLTSDCGKIVTFTNAAAVAVTLPEAGTAGFEAQWYTRFVNLGAGDVTVTPTTSTINGSASITLTTNHGLTVASDGTNYVYEAGLGILAETQGIQDVFAIAKAITGANSEANCLRVGESSNYWCIYYNATDGHVIKPSPLVDSQITAWLDKRIVFYDAENTCEILAIDPDAADAFAAWTFTCTNTRPLVDGHLVLRVLGDCSVAEEAIVTNDPLDEWITCADTTGDAVTFNYIVPRSISSDNTVKITLYAVNKNASPSGTFTLQCAAQAVRMGTDAYAAHNTTGQQAVSFTTFDTQSRPEEASATFTLNGTLAAGAHIKGQCNVSATPAQIADIRLLGTGVIQVFAASLSN